jgi:hypothetical protein
MMEVLVQKALVTNGENGSRARLFGTSGFKGRRHPLSHAFYLFC